MLESLPSDAIVHILQRFELQALPSAMDCLAGCGAQGGAGARVDPAAAAPGAASY